MCFPEKNLPWKLGVIKKCYESLCIDLVEFLYFPKFNNKLVERNVVYDDIGALINSVKENCVFFLSGHFSNWELMAFSFPALSGESLNIITKRQTSRKLNSLITKFRSLSGNKMIETGNTLKEAFRVIKEDEPVCFLVDQAGHPDYSVYVEFFGKMTATFSGPAKLALAERPDLYFTAIIRNNDFTYRILSRKIEYDDLKERTQQNVEVLSQRIQTALEETIREFPDQWLWFHKRFKHTRES